MTHLAGRYRRRIPVVEAVQVTRDNLQRVARWCGGHVEQRNGHPAVVLPHGVPTAHPGDYIVREAECDGARYRVCKATMFEYAYEPNPPTA